MNDTFQIVAEINTLLQQQADALKGHLGVLEAAEYANRARRIRELFSLLERRPCWGSDGSKQCDDKRAVPLLGKAHV